MEPEHLTREQLKILEEARDMMHRAVDWNIDRQIYKAATGREPEQDGSEIATLTAKLPDLKGKRPLSVIFPDGREEATSTWKKFVLAVMRDCDSDSQRHETLMGLRGRVMGQQRTILADSAEGMDAPLQISEGLYIESKFDTESLLRVLTGRVLDAVGYDYGGILVRCKGRELTQGQTEPEASGMTMGFGGI